MVLATQPKIGKLQIMGLEGDEKLTWDHSDDFQIKKARDRFNELLKKGYKAFVSKDMAGTKKGEQITEFDPTAERLIMVPQFVGG